MSGDPFLGSDPEKKKKRQSKGQRQQRQQSKEEQVMRIFPPAIDLLPDICDVVRAVQKIQHDNLLTFSTQKPAGPEQEFVWVQGASNVRLFVDTFMMKLSGNKVQKFWHKQRLLSTLQAVEHVYADVLDIDEPRKVFLAFEFYHAWLPYAANKEFPVEVSTVAKLLNCFAWMCITSFPTPTREMPFVPGGYCWAELLSYPPEESMRGNRVINVYDGHQECDKKGIKVRDDPPDMDNALLFEPMNISPDWFSLECPVDVYTRWWLSAAQGKAHDFINFRLMSELKFFLTTVIAHLKNDIDMVSTMQTKIMGSMATLAFAGVSHAMSQVQSEYGLD